MPIRGPIILLILLSHAGPARSQESRPSLDLMAHGALAHTFVDRVPLNRRMGEIKFEQVNITATAGLLRNHFRLLGTLNLEGLTMPGGVLTLGGWGEGLNERRHPHTYAHELMLWAVAGGPGNPRASIAIGKGFATFGTDDPMNRPALRFPVNHHWSQILERAMIAFGAEAGPVRLEWSLFNGDEPEHPGQWPSIAGRFGDSWSARASLLPATGVELQASLARVKSPEHRPGAGSDQDKGSVSGRVERPVAGSTLYLLAEWARTEEAGGFFRFDSWLFEGSLARSGHRPYYRLERTERPEEERTLDPFRSIRPHLDNSILGVTRWTVHTLGYEHARRVGPVSLAPLIEASFARVQETGGGIFDVTSFFGRENLWSLTVGIRVRAATGAVTGSAHRMGRYGVAEPATHLHGGT